MTEENAAKTELAGRRTLLRLLKRVTHSAVFNVCLGAALAVIGVLEMLTELFLEIEPMLQTYHVIMLFGIVTALRGVVEFMEGLDKVSSGMAANESRKHSPHHDSV